MTRNKIEFKSTLREIVDHVNFMIDVKSPLDNIKDYIAGYVEGSGVNKYSKEKIITELSMIHNYMRLQRYVYNSLLKFEGLGVL